MSLIVFLISRFTVLSLEPLPQPSVGLPSTQSSPPSPPSPCIFPPISATKPSNSDCSPPTPLAGLSCHQSQHVPDSSNTSQGRGLHSCKTDKCQSSKFNTRTGFCSVFGSISISRPRIYGFAHFRPIAYRSPIYNVSRRKHWRSNDRFLTEAMPFYVPHFSTFCLDELA